MSCNAFAYLCFQSRPCDLTDCSILHSEFEQFITTSATSREIKMQVPGQDASQTERCLFYVISNAQLAFNWPFFARRNCLRGPSCALLANVNLIELIIADSNTIAAQLRVGVFVA